MRKEIHKNKVLVPGTFGLKEILWRRKTKHQIIILLILLQITIAPEALERAMSKGFLQWAFMVVILTQWLINQWARDIRRKCRPTHSEVVPIRKVWNWIRLLRCRKLWANVVWLKETKIICSFPLLNLQLMKNRNRILKATCRKRA